MSGPAAFAAATALAGALPPPRTAALRGLRDGAGTLLDRAVVIAFPGPRTATGENVVELHCHGGRAVTRAVERALAEQPDCRLAEPGEFTRRALLHGRIDLAEVEGLADLLEAETEAQRIAALGAAEGRISRQIGDWLAHVAALSARIEAELDHADEDDVDADDAHIRAVRDEAMTLGHAIATIASAPPVERWRDGIRVVIGGPPNAGKSTLLNLLVERDAAIVSPIAGTTRDKIETAIIRRGIAYNVMDTAGLTATHDPIEAIGVERATAAIMAADVVVWLADVPPLNEGAIWVHARADEAGREEMPAGKTIAIRQDRSDTIDALWQVIEERAATLLPRVDALPLRERHRDRCREAADALVSMPHDPLLIGEHLRRARVSLAAVIGVNATEVMLDALFSRFCLGK